jgi:predicted PurR-regulated permease PerM
MPVAPRPIRARLVLKVLSVVGICLLAALVYPFASALVFAAVLAGALHPWQERLATRLGGRRQMAATLLTAAVVLVLVLPVAFLVINLGGQIAGAIAYLRQLLESRGLPDLVKDFPTPVRVAAEWAFANIPRRSAEIQELAGTHGGDAALAVGEVITATASAAFQVFMMAVALFFLLLDGPPLVGCVARIAPLPDGQVLEILTDFRNVSVAVLLSSLATAGVQALAAFAGFLLADAPQPVFFTLVTFIVAFVPALGATSVVLVAALLLFFTGHSQAALFLALWAVLVVGFIDNLVKPLLMKDRMEVHGALIFFALLGGLTTFGPVGLVVGPLILTFFLTVVRIADRERAGRSPAPVEC